MELISKKRLGLFSGRSTRYLADEVAALIGEQVGEANQIDFASGETYCRYEDSIRDTDVFIMQTHCEPVNEAIMEQLIMIDAARRASAKRIVAVCPYFGYGRQDRKALGREPITAKLVADMLQTAGAERVVSVDLHSGQIQGFFNVPVDHLTAIPVLEDYVRRESPIDPVIVAPDAGRVKTAERFAQRLGADIAFCHKRRPRGVANVVEVAEVIGDVDGRHCIVVDDEIATAGTVCAVADLLMERGATDVWIMATHAVLSGPAIERLEKSAASRVVVTNTLPIAEHKKIDKIEVLSAAGLIAQVIKRIFTGESVSDVFGGQNHF